MAHTGVEPHAAGVVDLALDLAPVGGDQGSRVDALGQQPLLAAERGHVARLELLGLPERLQRGVRLLQQVGADVPQLDLGRGPLGGRQRRLGGQGLQAGRQGLGVVASPEQTEPGAQGSAAEGWRLGQLGCAGQARERLVGPVPALVDGGLLEQGLGGVVPGGPLGPLGQQPQQGVVVALGPADRLQGGSGDVVVRVVGKQRPVAVAGRRGLAERTAEEGASLMQERPGAGRIGPALDLGPEQLGQGLVAPFAPVGLGQRLGAPVGGGVQLVEPLARLGRAGRSPRLAGRELRDANQERRDVVVVGVRQGDLEGGEGAGRVVGEGRQPRALLRQVAQLALLGLPAGVRQGLLRQAEGLGGRGVPPELLLEDAGPLAQQLAAGAPSVRAARRASSSARAPCWARTSRTRVSSARASPSSGASWTSLWRVEAARPGSSSCCSSTSAASRSQGPGSSSALPARSARSCSVRASADHCSSCRSSTASASRSGARSGTRARARR